MLKALNKSLLIVIILVFFFINNSYAQEKSSGFAISIPVSEENIKEGHIICSSTEGLVLCKSEYDQSMNGVISDNAAVTLEATGEKETRLMMSSGNAKVLVNGLGGGISEGDQITSSLTAGVGMKATKNGYVLGTALEDFEPADENDTSVILVAINIHPAAGLTGARSDLIQALRSGLRAPLFEPLAAFRYLLAALIILFSFVLGFIYFGRVSRSGVEAIGRNPLAGRMIQMSILLHIVVTIVIIAAGLVMAYLILIL